MPRNITKDDIYSAVEKMDLPEFLKLINHYSDVNDVKFEKEKVCLVQKDLQKHLEFHKVNGCCPYCKSKMLSTHGCRNEVKRLKCEKCQKTFTLFTGTIMEKTKFS